MRSWFVNARSMAEPREMEVSNSEGLDAIFRAHDERIARVTGISRSASALLAADEQTEN